VQHETAITTNAQSEECSAIFRPTSQAGNNLLIKYFMGEQIVQLIPIPETGYNLSNRTVGRLLVVAEAPSKEENLLAQLLKELGIERKNYGYSIVCRCLSVSDEKVNGEQSENEVINCLSNLATLIEEMKPSVILTVGGAATEIFCGKGNLLGKIQDREKANNWSSEFCTPHAQELLKTASCSVKYIVPVHYPSPTIWKRNALIDATRKELTKKQIAKAAQLMTGC
jgi:DNA polymerase